MVNICARQQIPRVTSSSKLVQAILSEIYLAIKMMALVSQELRGAAMVNIFLEIPKKIVAFVFGILLQQSWKIDFKGMEDN